MLFIHLQVDAIEFLEAYEWYYQNMFSVFVLATAACNPILFCFLILLDMKLFAGGNADYGMDFLQKDQFRDSSMSMMQNQHFTVCYL